MGTGGSGRSRMGPMYQACQHLPEHTHVHTCTCIHTHSYMCIYFLGVLEWADVTRTGDDWHLRPCPYLVLKGSAVQRAGLGLGQGLAAPPVKHCVHPLQAWGSDRPDFKFKPYYPPAT